MRTVAVIAMLAAGCSLAAAPAPKADWPPAEPAQPLPPLVGEYVAEEDAADGWRISPISGSIEHGVAYEYTLQHCGLSSPVDVDGSFWDPTEAHSRIGARLDLDGDTELINATSGTIVVIGDEARFRMDSGTVVRFSRHEGAKGFDICV
jgi:hypothetical protein